jgi:MiaB/RimO family radical SAM methylthiotransferase
VKQDITDGCKEIWLSSTDNGCYGLDIGTDLPDLVNAVAEIEHDFMIRIGMMNPMYMPRIRDRLLQSFENDKVFKFLHIPVQSGSDSVLKDMKRGHTAKVFRDTDKKFRKKFEKFTISTDIIVGFPSETETDFAQTVDLIKETRPDIINLSRYSPRPGTRAAKMEQMEVSEVKRRSKIVFELAKSLARERNEEWLGWQGEVLFDESSDGMVKGRNFAYKPVVVEEPVKLGQKFKVEIIKATQHGLLGKTLS